MTTLLINTGQPTLSLFDTKGLTCLLTATPNHNTVLKKGHSYPIHNLCEYIIC